MTTHSVPYPAAWPVCERQDVRCTGVRTGKYNQCLEHLSSAELQNHLARISENGMIDARGTRLSSELVRRILAALPVRDGRPVLWNSLFTGAVFTEDAYLTGVAFRGITSFEDAQFRRRALFNQTLFGDAASFSNVQFHGVSLFHHARFGGTADFSSALFVASARLDETQFDARALFPNVRFASLASFEGAAFMGTALFSGAKFDRVVSFERSRFVEEAHFDRVGFAAPVSFKQARFALGGAFHHAVFRHRLLFDQSEFNGPASFSRARFGARASFVRTHFGARASFDQSEFLRVADFWKSTFSHDAAFDGTHFAGWARFDRARFDSTAFFHHAVFDRKACFDATLSAMPIPLGQATFRGALLDGIQVLTPQTPEDTRARGSGPSIFITSPEPVVLTPPEPVVLTQHTKEGVAITPPTDRRQEAARGLAEIILDNQAAVLALLGILIYGMFRGAHDAFYGDLGVTPEEVGITYLTIVPRAALGLVVYLVVLAVSGSLVLLLASAIGRQRFPDLSSREAWLNLLQKPSILMAAFVFCTLPFLVFLFWRRASFAAFLLDSAVRLIGLTIFVALLLAAFWTVALPGTNKWAAKSRLLSITALAFFLALLLAGVLALSHVWGEYRASEAARGVEVTPSLFLGIQAEPVCVTWIGNDPRVPPSRAPLMFLGQANSVVAFYDASGDMQRKTLRVPVSKAYLTHLDSRDESDSRGRDCAGQAVVVPTTTTVSTPPTTTKEVEDAPPPPKPLPTTK